MNEYDRRDDLKKIAAQVVADYAVAEGNVRVPADSVIEKYAAHLDEILTRLIPEKIGPDYEEALAAGDAAGCVASAAKYFRERPDCPLYPSHGGYSRETADRSVKGSVTSVSVEWTFPDGRVDFLFEATEIKGPLNHEWLWQLNRHGFWTDMARAWADTKEEKYAKALCRQIADWVAYTDLVPDWNSRGSAWRTIECGLRLSGSWPHTFETIRKASRMSDALLLIFLASMRRQAKHLHAHPTGRNWLLMEANGMMTFSCLYPEFSDSDEICRAACAHMVREVEKQVMSDGVHNELSPDYHGVAISNAAGAYRVAQAFGRADAFPPKYAQLIKDMIHAGVLLSTPRMTQPRVNDTYTIFTARYTRTGEDLFGKCPEYSFINTCRAEGEPPREGPSVFFPRAGLAVMRSDWGPEATYACFDVGPLGNGHIHQDKLNIQIWKGSEELIYDDGGGEYDESQARLYGRSSYAHNVVLVDGMGQERIEPKVLDADADAGWITSDAFDYAYGVYDDVYGKEMTHPATHKREVRFVKPGFFAVADTMTSCDGQDHEYEALFHMDTTRVKSVPGLPGAILSDFGKKYDVLIVPADDSREAEPKIVSAQTEPYQGWFNGRNAENLHPAVTVSRGVRARNCVLRTLLIPVKSGAPLPDVKIDGRRVSVTLDGREYAVDFEKMDQ